jgi:hypothetical protein
VLGPSPFALPAPTFRFKALALAAGRAPLGGPRESALAALMGARLASGLLGPTPLPGEARATRADAARGWLGSIAVPSVTKVAVSRLIEASGRSDLAAVATAMAKVTEVTAPYLDRAAHSELELFCAALRG